MFNKYIDPGDLGKVKKDMGPMGDFVKVTPVDNEYAFVPTNLSQSAKGGTANLKQTSDMNLKRFGLE
jgi:hypothetical protein